MLAKLICQDQALLRDLTRSFSESPEQESNSLDEDFDEEQMIQRYYALKEQVSGSVNLVRDSPPQTQQQFLNQQDSNKNIEIADGNNSFNADENASYVDLPLQTDEIIKPDQIRRPSSAHPGSGNMHNMLGKLSQKSLNQISKRTTQTKIIKSNKMSTNLIALESLEDKLFKQKLMLKQKVSELQLENSHLKHQIRLMDTEFKRKDQLVHRLADELKKTAYIPQQNSSPQRQQVTWTIAGVYAPGTQSKPVGPSKAFLNNQDLRRQIKDLKADLSLKENELLNTQMTTKFLRLTELETQVISLQSEVATLNTKLQTQRQMPSPEHMKQLQYYENQLRLAHTSIQQQEFKNNEQAQLIQQLNKNWTSTQGSLQKVNKRNKQLKQAQRSLNLKLQIAQRKNSNFQIMSKKLTDLGLDVNQIIQTEKNNNPKVGKNVLFTFLGPAGLIEGGSNQKITLIVDVDSISRVSDLKQLLQKELDIDDGIDIILREKEAGKRIKTVLKLKQACNRGAITVEFVELNMPEIRTEVVQDMSGGEDQQDNEEQYSDAQFEQDDQPAENEVKQMQAAVVKDDELKTLFSDIRLYLMIKNIPWTHMARYLSPNEPKTNTLSQLLHKNFPIDEKQSTKLARFIIEPEGEQVEIKDYTLSRPEFINRLRVLIPNYNLLNGLAITSMLNRLHELVEIDQMNDFYEDLTLEDEDSEGVLKWSQIIKIWRINNLPQLDDELEEFLLWLAMRNSDGSNRIYIQKFFSIFQEDYLIERSSHEEDSPFDTQKQPQDSVDLNQSQQAVLQVQEESQADNQDDILYFVDTAVRAIVNCLPKKNPKQELNEVMLPHLQLLNNEHLCLTQDTFLQLLQELNIQMSQHEVEYLLQMLVRDVQDHQLIFYREFFSLVSNYLQKQNLMLESLRHGIEYRAITEPTFQFLLQVKDVLNVEQLPVVTVIAGQAQLKLVPEDEFYDYLFMKHQLRTPSQIPDFRWLVCVPGYVVVNRLKRVLHDLNFLHIDIYGILKQKEQYSAVREAQSKRWTKLSQSLKIELPLQQNAQQIQQQSKVSVKPNQLENKHQAQKIAIHKQQEDIIEEEQYSEVDDESIIEENDALIEDYYGD